MQEELVNANLPHSTQHVPISVATEGEPLFINHPLLARHHEKRKQAEADGRSAPRISGLTPSCELLHVIPTSRHHKITPQMWENMELAHNTRHLWNQDMNAESDPWIVNSNQALFSQRMPKKRLSYAVGFNHREPHPLG